MEINNPIKKLLIIEDDDEEDTQINKIINKGTGAGGSNTNYYGKLFEDKTNNEYRLIKEGYSKLPININKSKNKNKFGYYLFKNIGDISINFVLQSGLKEFIKEKYNIELFRCPDEAYIVEKNGCKPKLIILEKKEQNCAGSVDTKLLAGYLFREEYEEALEYKFDVHYGFCVSKYLQDNIMSNTKKWIIFNNLMKKHNIEILFGDDENYFEMFDKWFNKLVYSV